ncbi:MAG: class I SAM-dependent methyltransferase [Halovenus sp.]
MNPTQRQQVRDNAKYLRQVRPIDPDEIAEYVEGTPHPAAVRQVLRESATELALLERRDGAFEPVPGGPIEVEFDGVDRLPAAIERKVIDLLAEEYGPGWPDGETGARLRAAIREFKQRYFAGQPVTYDTDTAFGYAIYHLPPYYAAAQYVLAELAAADLLDHHLRVLDVGAGVGGPALGLAHLLPDDALVEYHAVEPSAATEILRPLLAETGRNVHTTVHEEPIEEFDIGTYDLVLCANVLSELDDAVSVLSDLFGALAADGTLLALAPADRYTATHLRRVERALEREVGATVYAPTVRLWPGETPDSECWSFDRKGDIAVPDVQRRLAEGRGPDTGDVAEFLNVDVQYAYSVLRPDDRTALSFTPSRSRYAKLADSPDNVTERIDCVAVKLSHNLAESGHPLFLVGDGSEPADHFAVLTDPSALNGDLERAGYGDLLSFENVLVLWNDDEVAYNLVVEGETVVDRFPA